MRQVAIVIFWASLAQAECIEVDSPKIRAGDLAEAVPLFQGVDATAMVGFSPVPGAERVLSGRELALFAERQGVQAQAGAISNVCVKRRIRPLSREDLQNAMMRTLQDGSIQVELLAYSNQLLPPGRLEFKLTGLNKPPVSAPQTPVIWRGSLIYDGDHTSSVWAQVRIGVERSWVVAKENISEGAIITTEQVQTVQGREFPFPAEFLSSAGAVAGKLARKTILAGQKLLPGAIEDPPDVTRGQKVGVKSIAGGAVLTLEAVAESSGKKGDTILVHNPVSGRNFHAVVQDKGQVIAEVTPGT